MWKNTKKKQKKEEEEGAKRKTLYTIKLDDAQMAKLEQICDRRGFAFYAVEHARWGFKSPHEKVNVVGYKSGKLVVQGKGTEDFVQHVIEAEITGEARLGYDEVHHPEWFEAHAGLDEAGKGDLFGPLVSCAVVADGEAVRSWLEKGVRDSKTMTDTSILRLEKEVRKTRGVVVKTAYCGMAKYNHLMAKPRANLNRLLAWLHARSLQAALAERMVPWGLLDQFSKEPLTQRQLKKDGFEFDLHMRTKAESDPVVAAASICARAEFVRQMKALGEEYGEPLKKGAGAPAKKQAEALFKKLGREGLERFAKMHFKTAYEVQGLPVPERSWSRKFDKGGSEAEK